MFAQINLLKEATKTSSELIKSRKTLTSSQVTDGLIEALMQGSQKSVKLASVEGGFYKNELIRIPFPEDANKMKETLLKLGMTNQIKEFEQTINSAAELASKKALKILSRAIRSINITDAFAILNGDDNSATEYLKKHTYGDLQIEFMPIIKLAIEKVELSKYWDLLVNRYNTIPFTKKVNPNLEKYITTKTVEGLFLLIEKEEINIRNNPKARGTDLLQKVFN